ncbi:CRTAC1 family protein [Psychromarinibacter sp. C21-152]|uniref:CRTAC1 family protein n=1 Tax=Psychromarinibacter sediminicola TaxID=3033385 RepID=A0AAE3T795_9RHOB|nr:CRTAC1 family protein [Psychromarinibacter sediminicola]MDF0599408.1 CRTAC1 family protein [Psychromarinibacter sediminicola]
MLTGAGGPVAAAPAFERVAVPEHVYSGGWAHFVGGGLAVFDCNDDRLPDLFAAGGESPAALWVNRSAPGGEIVFEPLDSETPAITDATGAYPLDIDSDGLLDLVVLRAGGNRVLRGLGDCTFAPTDAFALDPGDRWTTAFSATWEAGRSLPTLAFGNYVDRDDPDGPFRACDDNQLFRPEGARYGAAETLTPGYCALSILFTDWGRRGRADLRISNDRHYYVRGGEEQMWAMEDTPRLYTAEDGWNSFSIWGMGIAQRDLTGDGLPEVYLTSMADQKLQMLENGGSAPSYRDATYDRGTTAHRPHVGDDGRPSTGWHVAFGDVDNDGRDDIFVAKGNVEQMPGLAMKDPNNLLMQQADGTFAEAAADAGIASFERSRGAALVDLNADGLLDLTVVNRRAPLEVYRNVTAPVGNWLSVALRQPAPNTRAVGAWIEVEADGRRHTREITVGGGHAGGSAAPEHFGLGDAQSVRLRVVWPDGETSAWVEVETGQALEIGRDGGALTVAAY